MNRLKNAYLDSNVFVYATLYKGELAKKAEEYLRKASDGDFVAFTSSLTWDEVVYAVRKVAGVEESIEIGKLMLKIPFLKFLEVNHTVCEEAQKIIEKYKVMPRDAIHAALALKYCDVIVSNDRDFDLIEGLERVF
ncbi:VapC toxin family PIN domain ribonuclease [Archaeoglobales archaeon]|nr:MAG: VapC toxin family PIN domain ribonuclease [Archaeoglobales archaeon]